MRTIKYKIMRVPCKLKLTAVGLATFSAVFTSSVYAGVDEALLAYEQKNYGVAIQEFRALAQQGDSRAQLVLGVMYEYGKGVPIDYKQAAVWYLKAAEQRVSVAQYNLGLMYAKGHGVPMDYKQAAAWYLKAAEQGMLDAQYNLGVMYSNGQGVPQDYKQAAAWYLAASEQGAVDAQHNLGVLYEKGLGVTKNLVIAYALYEVCGSLKSLPVENRNRFLKAMSVRQVQEAQALARDFRRENGFNLSIEAHLKKHSEGANSHNQ